MASHKLILGIGAVVIIATIVIVMMWRRSKQPKPSTDTGSGTLGTLPPYSSGTVNAKFAGSDMRYQPKCSSCSGDATSFI